MRLILLVFLMCSNFLIAQSDNLEIVTIHKPQNYFLSSGSGSLLGDNNKIVLDVKLPFGTIKWYYVFSATRNKRNIERIKSSLNLLGQLTRFVDKTGASKIALDMITAPPGEDNCNVFLLSSYEAGRKFESSVLIDKISYFTDGSRKKYMSGVVEITHPQNCKGTQYIGIQNTASLYGVNVAIEVVAIVSHRWDSKDKQKFYKATNSFLNGNDEYRYLEERQIDELATCIINKFTYKYSPQKAMKLAEYEAESILNDLCGMCQDDLGLSAIKKEFENFANENLIIESNDFIGKWRDENSQFDFHDNGKFKIQWDAGNKITGKWKYSNKILWISFGKKKNFLPHEIQFFDGVTMMYKAKGSKEVFNAVKIH